MMSLAADIGGTYSRLAWLDDGTVPAGDPQVFRNAEFGSLEDVISHGLAERGRSAEPIGHMVLALPGPVQADPILLTNIDWQLRRDALQSRFAVTRLTIVNDFQAAALGATAEPIDRLKVLNSAIPDDGAVVIAGAGTGLGMAWMPDRGPGQLPRASEGGHLDFAPNDPVQLRLYRELAGRFGHVSYERIVSGNGLVSTYRFLAGTSAEAATPAQIVSAAARGDGHATEAVQLFVAVFAAYAGNLALAFNPTGGLYLCGGLAVHLAEWFDPLAFQSAFAAKGRMADMVRRIPVFLVTRHDAGLAGAIMIARHTTGQ